MTGTNAPGTNAPANLSGEESNFVVVSGDAVHVPVSGELMGVALLSSRYMK